MKVLTNFPSRSLIRQGNDLDTSVEHHRRGRKATKASRSLIRQGDDLDELVPIPPDVLVLSRVSIPYSSGQ